MGCQCVALLPYSYFLCVAIEVDVLRLICGYALQCGRCLEEDDVYDELEK